MANQGPRAYVPNDIQRLVHKRKECEEAKDYHRVSAYELSNLIANCQYHVPEMKNLERVVGEVRYVYGQNFAEFYLMWQQEFERFAFLDGWLNFHALSRESHEFQPMRSEMLKRFSGSIVLAKWVVDGRWYRANLLSYDKDNNWLCTVYYTDKGNVELQELETLKIIPKEVRKIPSMIFRAALSGQLISPAEAWTRGHTNLEFLVRSTHSAVLQCEVLTVDTRAKHFLASVKLSVPYSLNERCQFLSINKVVMDTLEVEEKIGIFRSLTDGPLQAEKAILPHNLTLAFPVPSNDPSYYKITSMKSLRHFYVVEDTDTAIQAARNLYREIRNWSSSEEPYSSDKWKIATDRIIDNRIYMYWSSYSQWWERVQVTRTDTPSRSCFAFFVDNGKFGLVNQEDLREAPPFVFQTPARALRASLAHVTLANPNNNIAAKKYFQALTLGVRFLGACIGTDSVQDSWAPNGVDVNLMVFVDMSKIRARCGKIVTLQQELCIQQHVKSTGFVTGPSRLGVLGNPDARLYDRKCLKQVLVNGSTTNPECLTLAEAFVFDTLDDKHVVPDDDIDGETIDLKQYFQGDCKVHPIYENAGKVCSQEPYFSDQQAFGKLSSLPQRTVTYRYKKFVAYRPALKHGTVSAFEKTFAQYIGIGGVKVSYSEGPGVIYLQSLQRMSELEKMEKDMITLLQNYGIDIDYEEIEGSLLGGLLCGDADSVSPKWHRVFVYKAIPEKQIAKVLLVDYGNMANIPYKNLRLLPEYIYSVSFFCQRAHLDAKRGCLRQSRWTTRANRQFKEFLGLCKSITFFPSGAVGPNSEVPLIDYGQDVWFDDNELVWYGGGHTRDYPVMPVTGQSRTIFQHLVKSIGVNLWLESEFSTPGQITFENIEDILQ